MDSRCLVWTMVLALGLIVPAMAQNQVLIHEGFISGNVYRSFTGPKRTSYVMGWVDGVFVSPLFDAPDHTQAGTPLAALSQCVVGMDNIQMEAIFSKWLDEHPERWHESAHLLMYVAMDEVCHFPPEP